MLERSGSSSPPNLQEIAKTFRLTGWISFWVQLVLTVISSIILLFASALSGASANNQTSPSNGIGVAVTVAGILVLGFNMYWALFRYVPIGRKLAGNPAARPRKSETLQILRMGLQASVVGIFVSLLGAQATVGLLAAKAFNQGVGGLVTVDPSRFIQPLDILVVQASVNVILAQFFGISAALWLLNKMTR